jgi:hypothetical protein
MDNKKLINFLLKDMEELETLISDMKKTRQYDAIAMELAQNRTRSIMHLLQLLNEQDMKEQPEKTAEPKPVKKDEPSTLPSTPNAPETGIQSDQTDLSGFTPTESTNDISSVPPPSKYLESTNISDTIDHPRENPGKGPEVSNENLLKEKDREEDSEMPTAPSEPENKPGVHTPEVPPEENDFLEEESLNKDLQVRLIDSFLKGKSVNDLITDKHKLEFKLSNRPVGNIQKAIGINDRFQYIRELFDNDTEKFMETVKSIDSMQTATEAYQYLRTRYKWQKNETSLKFLHLVKRRFSNETSHG